MAQSSVLASARIQEIAGALDGIRAAPVEPVEQMNAFPFAVSYPARLVGATQLTANTRRFIYEIRTEIHVARKDLPRDVRTVGPYADSFPAAVWDDSQLNDAVDTVLSITGDLSGSEWGGQETLAWIFTTTVKVDPNAA